jgi:hypothetical protein
MSRGTNDQQAKNGRMKRKGTDDDVIIVERRKAF